MQRRKFQPIQAMRTVAGQLSRYLAIVGQEGETSVSALEYWSRNQNAYTKVAPIAQDLLSVPASQADVERIFHCVDC